MSRILRGILALGLMVGTTSAGAVELVSDATIKIQKDLTSEHKLKNGMTVIVRQIPDSDILQVNVNFKTGLKDLPIGKKVMNEWLWETVPVAGKGYPRAKVFELSAKYGFELGCQGGIEHVSCGLGTINDYWKEGLNLLAAVVKEPTLTDEDAALIKQRLVAQLKSVETDPGQYVNEIVNTIFYPAGFPYRLNHDEALGELEKLSAKDLKALHAKILNAANMSIVVVTSMPAKKVVQDLDKAFGGIQKREVKDLVAVAPPAFDGANAYAFNDRELPTAYIRIKLNAPNITDKDATATRFLYEILSEELGDVIRTKRSLSYAVHSYVLQYSIGVGVISASTSKPKETLEAIHDVLQQLKTKTYSQEELEEYKHGFATSYYLTQETHASLAAALSSSLQFYGNTTELYEMPRRLDQVTPADIKRLANELLVNPRVGVIFGRKEFEDSWAKDFIAKNLSVPAEKKS